MKKLFCIVLALWVQCCFAFDLNSKPEENLKNKTLAHWGSNITWLKLLGFEPTDFSLGKSTSKIISPEFFLSPNGNKDPSDELKKTLDAIYAAPKEDPNTHAQCRFRGRYLWLKTTLSLEGEPDVVCPNFNEFTANNSIKSLSIVLATGYLGNPASFYGHTLLKFNNNDSAQSSHLLDKSVNYGAIIPSNTNPVSYIFNGIFGRFEAGFSGIEYYFHTHNYGENELRDLWEYELDLTKQEVDYVVAHAWELLGQKYKYYFFRKNCAYRVAELVQIIDGINITPDNLVYTIPQSVLHKISTSVHHNKPLLTNIHYYPSRQSRLYNKYLALTAQEKAVVRNISENPNVIDQNIFSNLTEASKHRVVDTLLDYFQFIKLSNKDQESASYNKILHARFKLPPQSEFNNPKDRPISPHKGRKPSVVRIKMGHNDSLGNFSSLLIRPVYYDGLDAGAGHVANGTLSMAEVGFDLKGNELSLNHFDIFSVESINSYSTMLSGDEADAWRLKFGVEKQNLSCNNCVVTRLQGDWGIAIPTASGIIFGSYLGGAIQENKNDEGNIFARASLFAQGHRGNISVRTTLESRQFINGKDNSEVLFSSEARYKLSRNQEVRFKIEKNVAHQASISYGFYW